MFKFLADENIPTFIVRSIFQRQTTIDIVRVQDVGLRSEQDEEILEWAAQNDRIVLTHDAKTMVGYAYNRVKDNQVMPGLILIDDATPIGTIVNDLETIIVCSMKSDVESQALHIPIP